MPSPKDMLDIREWTEFLPRERANDQEFNLLLFKYKSLSSVLREYREQHSECSVSLKSDSKIHISDELSKDDCTTESLDKEAKASLASSPKSNGARQSVISLRRKFFQQQQDSGLPPLPRDVCNLSPKMKSSAMHANSLRRPNESSPGQGASNIDQGARSTSKHHNSSHNLTSSKSIDISDSQLNLANRPEVKQRNSQLVNSRSLSLSKSSERLDSLNNNHVSLATNISSTAQGKPNLSRQRPIVSAGLSDASPVPIRDSNLLDNTDDVIYDAVSPDDLGEMPGLKSVDSNARHNFGSGDQMPPVPPMHDQNSFRQEISIKSDRNSSSFDIKLPPKNSASSSRVQPPSSFDDSTSHDNHAFKSSIMLDSAPRNSHNNSSLSLVPNGSFKNQDYANYVNIDFFLKRSQSPSFGDDYGIDEDSSEIEHNGDDEEDDDVDDDDEDGDGEDDTTHLSHSISTDQICEDLKQLSPRDLARKLSIMNQDLQQTLSSTSITPASSGDFLDDVRSPTATIQNQHTSTASTFSRHFDEGALGNSSKFNSFMSPVHHKHNHSGNHQNDSNFMQASAYISASRSSLPPNSSKLAAGNENQLINHRTLDMIHEDQLQHHPIMHRTQTIPPRQTTSNRDSNLQLDQFLSPHSSIEEGCSSDIALAEAHSSMRSFLSDLNLSPVDDVFKDKAQRRIVKESFAVEYCGRRKLRHLFLFNDVIVCAKYQASSKQKFTFDVKWYLNLNAVTVSDITDPSSQAKFDLEAVENQILAIRTNLMILRGKMQQIKRSKDKKPSKLIKKLKKKRTELEAELVLLLPHLPLVIKHSNNKKYLFFLSSNFDRNQWVESIKYLQSQLPAGKSGSSSPSSSELQAWIQTCRKNLNPSLGTFLLRSNCDDDLLYGDLYINLNTITGIPKPGHYYFCFEVDSYGHFSQKASSVVLRIDETDGHQLNDEYIFPLDGAHTLRLLLYEDQGQNLKPSVVGKAHVELSRAWCLDRPVERQIGFNSNCSLSAHLSYSNSEILSMRIPHSKLCSNFGIDIVQVCKKEKTQVPLLIQLCVNEVERRGMREVGIYRMSGTSTDIQRLKKAFEANPLAAELLLRDIDINSVTGFLKTYLREMPEGLFINKLYPKFVEAFKLPQSESVEKTKRMLELFHKIPNANQHTIAYLVQHLVKVNKYESYNKMSLTNLATVLGPNILRAPSEPTSADTSDFTAVVICSMSQAGILYFFLNRAASNLSLSKMDSSETSGTSEA